ncbi:TetR/AcrR family transcriptional regulator [Aquimarina agarivorans]|uniref:TetR/AcrR family transcriptional regulator n=1 Tax=Aquimarina agarivorans TaxID=980584 RepID=UPI000248E6E7|nr:TetR/AcrR family transcriptional regulator [Aquimarina agarivorans]
MNKKSLILQVTLELITTKGIENTSLTDIIKAADVAKGTLYHHFKKKEEIIEELYTILTEDFGTVIMRNTENTEDGRKKYQIMWLNLYHYFIDNPLAFIFSEQIGRSPEIPLRLKEKTRVYYADIEQFFRKRIQEKTFRQFNTLVMQELFFGSVVSIVKIHENDLVDLEERHIKQAIEISWKGFCRH